jgi:hypothetical protein
MTVLTARTLRQLDAVYSSILTALLEHGVRKTFTDLDHHATLSTVGRRPAGLERRPP